MKKEVEFKSDNLTLRGTLFTPDSKKEFGGVIFYHGSGSTRKNYLPISEALLERGIASLAFDFRGCGESEGDYEKSSVNDTVIDGQAALEFLLKQPGITPMSIGLVGVSRGGFVAATIAGRNPNIISMILRAPVAYPKDLVEGELKDFTVENWVKEKEKWADSPVWEEIKNYKNYLLIVASEKDELVPLEMVEEFKNRSSALFSEIQVMVGAKHSLGEFGSKDREGFKKIVVEWCARGTDQ